MMSVELRREARWASEARRFDREAAAQTGTLAHIPRSTLARCAGPQFRSWSCREFRFGVMGALEGRSILDVGCGTGENAVLFAHRGARVTGLDVAPLAIEVARKRAKLNGVEAQTLFACTPVETAEFGEEAFDIVWCSSFLHRVVDDLAIVLERLVRWAKRDGLLVFTEPTVLSDPLRRLRALLSPAGEDARAGRPLEGNELGLILGHFREARLQRYDLFGRLTPLLLGGWQGRDPLPLGRRVAVDLLWRVDQALLSLPGLRDLAGTVVVYGPPKKSRTRTWIP